MAAVRKYGFAIRVASDRLKDDEEVVLVAVKQFGHCLR
jgi:hypothetical protein